MSIFEKIFGKLNIDKGNPKPKSETNIDDDNVKFRSDCINAVTNAVGKAFGYSETRLGDKSLTIYVANQINRLALDTDDFKCDLSDSLMDTFHSTFKEVSVEPYDDSVTDGTKIADGLYLYIREMKTGGDKKPSAIGVEATIEILDDGSLIDGPVNLKPSGTYNIGVGKKYEKRVNQIALNDDENDPQYDANRYVSRSHAHITYNKVNGKYLLYVEPKGSRSCGGKRTQIIREDETKEIDDPKIGIPLVDGDIIVLSRSVELLFSLKK